MNGGWLVGYIGERQGSLLLWSRREPFSLPKKGNAQVQCSTTDLQVNSACHKMDDGRPRRLLEWAGGVWMSGWQLTRSGEWWTPALGSFLCSCGQVQ